LDRYGIAVFWSDEDGEWIGIAPDLRGCSASGRTPEEALREVQIGMEGWLGVARDHGDPVPEPLWRPSTAATKTAG
jgi:predicted RNase H-like HicB family nuclease